MFRHSPARPTSPMRPRKLSFESCEHRRMTAADMHLSAPMSELHVPAQESQGIIAILIGLVHDPRSSGSPARSAAVAQASPVLAPPAPVQPSTGICAVWHD